jgi:hypothetical protein
VISGLCGYDQSGYSVSNAGDMNGDGLSDLLVGVHLSDPSAGADAGRSYVVFGKTSTAEVSLNPAMAASLGFVINGAGASDRAGFSVSAAGDVNGDGLADVLLSANQADPGGRTDAGRSYVIFGSAAGGFMSTAVDQMGTTGADSLSSNAAGETLVGGAGNDTLTGNGGADVIYAGAGNDLIVLNSSNIAALLEGYNGADKQLSRVDGGTGFDTLKLDGTGIAFDLLQIANQGADGSIEGGGSRIESIEAIDLTGSGNNTLTLTLQDVLDMAGMNTINSATKGALGFADGSYTFAATERKHQLLVTGNEGDSVYMSGWVSSVGTVSYGVQTYNVYNQGTAQVLLDARITFNANNNAPVITSAGSVSVVEGSAGTVYTATASDADANATLSYSLSGADSALFTIDSATGAVSFKIRPDCEKPTDADVNNAYSISVTASDGIFTSASQAVTITVTDAEANLTGLGLVNAGVAENAAAATVVATLLATDTDMTGLIYSLAEGDGINDADNALVVIEGDQVLVKAGARIDFESNPTLNLYVTVQNSAGQKRTEALTVSVSDVSGEVVPVASFSISPSGTLASTTSVAVKSSAAGMAYLVHESYSGNSVLAIAALDDSLWNSVSLPSANSGMALQLGGLKSGNYKLYAADSRDNLSLAATTIVSVSAAPGVNLSAVAGGMGGFVINGQCASDASGNSVSGIGDVNGDGLMDVLVGSQAFNSNQGRAYVVFGKADGSAVDLSAIANGVGGYALLSPGNLLGGSISGAGDVNGDGLADLIVGARSHNSNTGRSFVVFGKTTGGAVTLSALGTGGFLIVGQSTQDLSGSSVSGAGDVNGDGLADLIVGAPLSDTGGLDAGRSYVVFGKTDIEVVNLSAIGQATGTGGFVINGQGASDYSGASVSGAGDVNGDGLADLIVGAIDSDANGQVNAGRSYVVFGKTGTAAVNLSAVSADSGGLVINGALAGDQSGYSVSGAGDVNGDGLADLIVSSVNSKNGRATELFMAGSSYVVFGKTSGAVNLSAVGQATGTGGFVISGLCGDDRSGYSVSNAGDMNGDGLSDLLVGVPYSDPSGAANAGRSYVVFGKTSTAEVSLNPSMAASVGFVINGAGASDQAGYSVSAAGDVNGDGLADLLMSANWADPGGLTDAGRSYVIFGSAAGGFMSTAADQVASSTVKNLTSNSASETLVGNAGVNVLTGNGGADVIYAGAGNDVIVLNSSNIAALVAGYNGVDKQLSRVDGGTGFDTLKLDGSGIAFDLTQVTNQGADGGIEGGGSRIESIEAIDLTGNGNNKLVLTLKDVLDVAGMNVINSGTLGSLGFSAGTYKFGATEGRHQLVVKGVAGESLESSGWGTSKGTVLEGSHTYDVYNQGLAQLLVEASLNKSIL